MVNKKKEEPCVNSADEVVKDCSIPMGDFFVEVGSRPDLHNVEEAKKDKEKSKLFEIVRLNKQPGDSHA